TAPQPPPPQPAWAAGASEQAASTATARLERIQILIGTLSLVVSWCIGPASRRRPPGSFPLSSSRRAPCAIALPRRCGFAQLRAAPSEPPAEPSRRGFSSGILEEEHTMRRRDFLHPRHLAGAAGHVLGALDSVRDLAPESADQLAVLRLGWRAMATGWE